MIQKDKKANAHCNQVILDHFWHISGPSEDRRCKSTVIILKNLLKQVENQQYNDLNYCLNRLIRGLLSDREFARHGFCLLLTQLLISFPEQIKISQVIEIAEKEYGQFKEESETETTIAWTLFISCLLKSKRITLDLDEEILTKLFDTLFVLGCKKSYVELIVCQLMNTMIETFQNESIETLEKMLNGKIKRSADDNNLFKTYLILLIYEKFQLKMCKNFIWQNVYRPKSKDFTNVIKLMKESTKYSPNSHPVNVLLIRTMKNIDQENLETFFSKLIENIFNVDMIKTSLGFEMIPILLDNVQNNKQIKIILSSLVLRNLIQSLSNKKHPLHNSSLNLSEQLVKFCADNRNDSIKQIEFAKCFIEKPGSINFDDLSRSRLLSNILKNFNYNSIEKWTRIVEDLMFNEENIGPNDFFRVRCLQKITQLLKNYNGQSTFLMEKCKFLFLYAYFKVNDSNFKYPISEKLREQFAHSFQNVFLHLCSQSTTQTDSSKKLIVKIEIYSQMRHHIMVMVNTHSTLMDNNISMNTLKETLNIMNEKLDSISSDGNNDKSNVLRLLYLHLMIESFENLDEILAILPDFNDCVDRAMSKSKNKTKEQNDPVWSDVLLELLISMITKSKYTKNIIITCFRYIVPFITDVGLQCLNDAFLNNEAVDIGDDDQDFDDDEEDEEAENHDDDNNVDDSVDDDDDDDDEIIEETDNDKVDEQFKMDLLNVLGKATDKDEDDDSECLSDSEMFKLDESLAEVFRKRFGNKKQQNEKRNLLQSFKLRILELIAIFVDHRQPLSIGMVFTIAKNIMTFLKSNHSTKNQSPLTPKCLQIITQIPKTRPVLVENENITQSDFHEMLNISFQIQYKCSNGNVQQALISFTNWIVTIYKQNFKESEFIFQVFEETLNEFFQRNNNEMKTELFKLIIPKLIEWKQVPLIESAYFEKLLKNCTNPDLRIFKRCSALDIANSIWNRCNNNQQKEKDPDKLLKLTEQLSSELLMAIKSLSKTKPNSNYINSLIQLLTNLGFLQFQSDSLEKNKTEILITINGLPKDVRKRINKSFIHRLKNIKSNEN